ncbi:Nuclear cap-binding protein complex subunit 1 [Wickerhamomyces ciferrii]|uniref:Nuclear cap-binding protein complex subunit 1 n=1 Tax=Wickerhamomyces ciferrii (strain ATCC 14091 / BCRC 22168 / CBS 111 / JCM 3599 / NBRC 0793 / NRRL Y-1031 F-60-10) TaxID=1206466 RepID=K0KXE4_WICCF|nr:Nuclear cap-binding protein complex subunit 1 [Wickerhamomyces ciferrii]CCH46707.1 Nuclear cap-binding protein complex subunit 1 [Wickerhamomyces ciferrii]
MSGFNRKRRFVELSKTLCGDINTLGESSKKYVEDVEFMTTPIIGNFETEKTLRDAVLSTLFGVVTEQPQKVLHISGLVQVVSSKSPAIGKIVAEFFHQKAQEVIEVALNRDIIPESFETGPWNKLKLILRFLSTLTSILRDSSLISIYLQFLNFAIDLQNSSPDKRNALAEAIFYNTLINVPYLVSYGQPSEELKKGINEILTTAEGFKIVKQNISITKPFVVKDTDAPYEAKSIVELILPAVKEFLSEDFTKVHKVFPELGPSLQHLIVEIEKVGLPQFSIQSVESYADISGLDTGIGSVDGMWRTQRLTFEVYLPVYGFDTVPKSTDFIGLLFDDIVIDIVEALEFNRKEVARQIITLDLFFANGVFAPPASSVDNLKEIHQNNQESEHKSSTWKTEDVAIKNVLSLIFKLPDVSQPFAYFYTTLVEACTNAASAIAPVLGRAIRFFYSNIHITDFELRFRYLDWLAVQLSNFNFTWKWREWEVDSAKNSKSKYHPRIVFIKNIIAKELRLATSERIQQTLTEEFHQYLNTSLFESSEIKDYYVSLFGEVNLKDVNLNFDEEQNKLFFLSDNVSLKEDTEKLIEILHREATNEEYTSLIKSIKEKIKDYKSPDALLITFVFQVIAFVGNRSISHAGKYVGNTFNFLRTLLGKESSVSKEKGSSSSEGEIIDSKNSSGDAEEEEGRLVEVESPNVVAQRELWAVDAIIKYWNSAPENGYLVLDVLESYDVISSESLIRYSLNDDNKYNLGLVNVSATESIFRLLSSAAISGNSSNLLKVIYGELTSILEVTTFRIEQPGEIEVPDVNDEVNEKAELIWKYHTTLGFLKAIIRKYSGEFLQVLPEINNLLDAKITHEPTKSAIKSFIEELKYL